MLPVIETFLSIQGEGSHTGVPCFFIRVAGCKNACPFCDTKQSWNPASGKDTAESVLAEAALHSGALNCVVTGGEPLLYDMGPLCKELHARGLHVWLETSGSEPLTGAWDWVCLSPKRGIPVHESVYAAANELKVVISNRSDFEFAESQAEKTGSHCRLMLQPEWNRRMEVQPIVVDYLLSHPRWNLSLQAHKYLGIS